MLIKSGKYAILCGFVARDADVRQTQSGRLVVNFSVKYAETSNQDNTKTAHWMNCVAWQKEGEVARYIAKGDTVFCAGELKERSYNSRDGEPRTVIELVCEFITVQEPPAAAPILPHTMEMFAGSAPPEFEEVVDDDDLPF